ncbi:toll-like receptor 13 [Magallana gigas]|uniref:toll-like receptor 13 n=1 Tax=Magallana gigas TaxID=29159 RepID=UPI00334024D6
MRDDLANMQARMDMTLSILMLIVMIFKGNGELSLVNTSCPSVCECNGNTATCEGHDGSHLRYIPPLPEHTTSLVFNSNKLGYMGGNAFKNISGLYLTRLELRRSHIFNIDRLTFQMLPHLQYLDLSENKALHSKKLHKAFFGLRNGSLREIRLTNMRLNTLFEDFFLYLSNTSLERVYFDDNIIISNIGDVMSPLSSHLREISFKSNQISNVSFNIVMPKMEVFILSKNKLLSIPNFCYFHSSRTMCPNLKVLDLSDNLISVVKGGKFFRKCLPKIQRLFLGYNKIKTLGKNFISLLPYLVYLSIENLDPNVTLHEYSLNSSSLQYLYMGNRFNVLKYYRNLFNNTRNLRVLDMTGVQFILSHNLEEKMFQLFKPLTGLEELTLKKTSLSTFPVSVFQFMPNLTKLSLQDCYFNQSYLRKLSAPASLKVILLDNNLITSINETNIPNNIDQMSLKSNPFLCTCDLVFFRKWIETNSKRLLGWPNDYTCNLPQEWKGKNLADFHLSYLSCHPINPYIIMAISISFAVLVIATVSCIIYKKRWHIKYYLYLLRAKKRGYEVLGGDDFAYDVFVAYNSDDRIWVISEMIPRLENEEHLKLCLHDRDFQVGKLIVDNITDAMHRSRKILIILSNSFAQSHWCRFETMMAQLRSINHGENTVVVVILENILTKNMNNSLHMLLKSTTFIEWTNERTAKEMFWTRLVSSIKT